MSKLSSDIIVIDAIISDNSNINEVVDIICPDDFEDSRLKVAYKAAVELYQEGKPADLVTVSEKCKKLFQSSYLADIVGQTAYFGTDIIHHAERIREQGQRRRLQIALKKAGAAISDPEAEFPETIENLLAAVQQNTGTPDQQISPENQLYKTYLERKAARERGEETGIMTGFHTLDTTLGGLQPGTLTVIAARSTHGKSTLASDCAYRAAMRGMMPLWIGLEAPASETVSCMIQKHAGISPLKIKQGDLSGLEEFNFKAALKALKAKITYCDTAHTLSSICLKIREAAAVRHVQMVVVDYLQLIDNSGVKEARHVQLAGVSRALKRVAMDLNLPVIALSQLNKGPEERVGHKITMADIRESEAISHDADHIIFLHRPSFYDPDDDEPDFLELAKNRHGDRISKIPVKWNREKNTYRELDFSGTR